MNRNICRSTRQEIDQSELGARLSAAAEAHAAECRECEQFKAERHRLRDLVGSLTPVAAPADFDMRLRARMARERATEPRPSIFRVLMSTPGIAVAAVMVMLVASIVWFNQRTGTESSNSATATPVASPTTTADSARVHSASDTTASISNPPVTSVDPTKENDVVLRPRQSAGAGNRSSRSSDFSVSRAPAIRLTPDRAGEVSLSAPLNPMVVSVRDEHGTTRRILLPPVSFGSQRLPDNRVPVSMNNTRDW